MSDEQAQPRNTQPGDVRVGTDKVIPVRQWWSGEAEKHIQKQADKAAAEKAAKAPVEDVPETADETDGDTSHSARKTKK